MLIEIGLAATATLFAKAVASSREKIHGIYSQPGPFYWVKWVAFYVLYWWRARRSARRQHQYDDGSDLRYLEDDIQKKEESPEEDFLTEARQTMAPAIMERTHFVADSRLAVDAVYFNGFTQNGSSIEEETTIVLAFAARYRNYAEIMLFLNAPEIGFLQHPAHPDRIVCDSGSDDYTYTGQGITIEMLEPMRRWRLKYNGLMRLMEVNDRKVAKESDRLVRVKFSLTWRSYSDYVDFNTDISASCMAHAVATEAWNPDFFRRVQKDLFQLNHYEQWGTLQGVVQVAERQPKEVVLRGMRDHSFGQKDWRRFHRYLACFVHLNDGTSINVTNACMDSTISRFATGYVIQPNHDKENITKVDMKLWEFGEDGFIPKEISFAFTAGGRTFVVVCQIRVVPEFYNGFEWEGRLVETLADYQVNGISGRGIAEFYYRHGSGRRTMDSCQKSLTRPCQEPDIGHEDLDKLLTVNLRDAECLKNCLVGGKGSQLAMLKEWSTTTKKFIVPDGFCITTSAHRRHVKEHADIQQLLNELSNGSQLSDEQTRALCARITAAFEKSVINKALKEIIQQKYKAMDCNNNHPAVAVRSSAVGEDSSDLSAAGQLGTLLGISGLEEVSKALKKCWGDQYSYNAVKYRRQHGQRAISSMGVVIQLLVDAKVSGVMFTQHPVTGNPAHTLINSNYGLGETVVSGSTEPDTIVVACNPNNNAEILSRHIGSKLKRMSVTDSWTIEHADVASDYSCRQICLKDENVFELVDVGQIIQTYSGAPRDIEWAISVDGKINLLQSRPITGDPTVTRYELMHEFDSAYSNDNYVLTTANIGEMMTGPVTPLSSSTLLRSIDYSVQAFCGKGCPRQFFEYNEIAVTQSHGHFFLNYMEMLRTHERAMLASRKDSIDVNIFGKVCDKVSLKEAIDYHKNDSTIFQRIRNTVTFWKYLFGARKEFDEIVEKAKHLRLVGRNSKEMYKSISENLGPYYAEGWRTYLAYVGLSGVSSTVLIMILSGGKTEWKTEHYSDVAMIYSTCENVVSVSAPMLLKETARHIFESNERDHFINCSSEDAVKTLIENKCAAGETFRRFLDICGHRCLRESEFREPSWATDPAKLGMSLQAMVKNFENETPKPVTSVEEAISKIKSPLTTFGKYVMRWAIPRARKSVAGREYGKSNAVKISDKFKQAYWKLAWMLENEEYLPDRDLMFFLTHGEIGRLLRTRSSRLVSRAMRRRRIHNEQWKLLFDEFQDRIPAAPSRSSVHAESNGFHESLRLQGCPVSHGVVNGRARVVTSLPGADEIKKGEILIVRTTDVGWSPYFPLISGLVTEIGGLISHGAIVAREYGLPCIVSAKKATQLFKTGDFVQLDGGSGTICKLLINPTTSTMPS